jgi:putative addiction module component (TIGR02574 family)
MLPAGDREWLAQELWASVEEREITADEGAEWKRRLKDLESGRVQGVELEVTLARARSELRKIREAKDQSVGRS